MISIYHFFCQVSIYHLFFFFKLAEMGFHTSHTPAEFITDMNSAGLPDDESSGSKRTTSKTLLEAGCWGGNRARAYFPKYRRRSGRSGCWDCLQAPSSGVRQGEAVTRWRCGSKRFKMGAALGGASLSGNRGREREHSLVLASAGNCFSFLLSTCL